jgi:hypothetical protein
LFLSQRQYALDVLQRAGMSECHSAATPIDTQAKLSDTEGELLCLTLLSIEVWQVHFSTSPSPDLTSPMLCSRSVFTCMLLVHRISLLSSGFFGMSVALWSMVWIFMLLHPPH